MTCVINQPWTVCTTLVSVVPCTMYVYNTTMYVCVNSTMYVCVNSTVNMCANSSMYMCVNSFMYLCVNSNMYVCVNSTMYICVNSTMYICVESTMYICVKSTMYVCVNSTMYICVNTTIYMCVNSTMYMYLWTILRVCEQFHTCEHGITHFHKHVAKNGHTFVWNFQMFPLLTQSWDELIRVPTRPGKPDNMMGFWKK